MLDRRQMILDRLADLLTPLAPNFWRNRGQLPAEKRPAITLCDADETRVDSGQFGNAKRGLAMAPSLMALSPEIIITLADDKPKNANVSQALSNFRTAIFNAVLDDPALAALVGNNGEIQYHGCSTDLARGRDMDGEMVVMLTFVYPFIPLEFKPDSP